MGIVILRFCSGQSAFYLLHALICVQDLIETGCWAGHLSWAVCRPRVGNCSCAEVRRLIPGNLASPKLFPLTPWAQLNMVVAMVALPVLAGTLLLP